MKNQQITTNLAGHGSRTTKKFLFFAFFFLLFSLFISCDLLSSPVNNDFLDRIDGEIAWTNAASLTVNVAYPSEWGSSPQSGTGNAGDVRQGYPFTVEFTPAAGYGFQEWLAFPADVYNGFTSERFSQSADEIRESSSPYVQIENSQSITGAGTASITINTTDPVILVPWSGSRPRLDSVRTNPPVNPVQAAFPFDQSVRLVFNMEIDKSTVILGETITISAIHIGNNRGQPFNNDGDITAWFYILPPENNSLVELRPNSGTASDLALLAISVMVGPGITGMNGQTMNSAEVVTYNTDTSEAQKVYEPGTISASRDGTDFFYDGYPAWNNQASDRRFNGAAGTVHIRFNVRPPDEDGAPLTPNRITLIERRAYDLAGQSMINIHRSEHSYSNPDSYLSGGNYTIPHQLEIAESGIIQLVVLPWYEDGDDTIPALAEQSAVAQGQYVTIVIDNAAPDLANPGASLSAPSSGGNGEVYVYGIDTPMTLTLGNLANLADNGSSGGILASNAWSLPWTMDNINNLEWYAHIGTSEQDEKIPSGWKNVYESTALNNTWTLLNLKELGITDRYGIYVKYRDSMGNVSAPRDTGLRVRYSVVTTVSVSNLIAETNNAGNVITAEWNGSSGYDSIDVLVRTYRAGASGDVYENEARYTLSASAESYQFSVPAINSSGVSAGNSVSGVYGYEISVIAHNEAGQGSTGPVRIYNIPDMSVTLDTPVILISTEAELSLTSTGAQYVLVNDITLSNWAPIGTDDSPFTGKLYGNGHTITVNGITNAQNTQHMGLFGVLEGNAIVRDLVVNYGSLSVTRSVTASEQRTTFTYFGGIAGEARGLAHIQNVVIKGYATITVNAIYAGGLIGWIRNNGSGNNTDNDKEGPNMDNAYAGLNLSITSNGGRVMLGGAIGATSDSNFRYDGTISNCSAVAGTIHINKASAGLLRFGGFIGNFHNGTLKGCYSENLVSLYQTDVASSDVSVGGFAGRVDGGIDIAYCYAKGSVSATVMTTGAITNNIDNNQGGKIGGFTGYLNGGIASECYASGNVTVISKSGSISAGGFAGYVDGTLGGLKNCYALGDIFVDKQDDATNNRLDAGGLIGRIAGVSDDTKTDLEDSIVEHSFAKGTVIGYNAGSGSSNVGGLSGGTDYRIRLRNSVALNEYLVLTTSNTTGRVIRRIYANSNNLTNSSNNYAYNNMVLYYCATNGVAINDGRMTIIPADNSSESVDGQTINRGSLSDRAFWQAASPGFSDADWIFDGVEVRGYPILRASVGGPALGGQ